MLQKIFKFRTCSLDIEEDDERWRWFRPCLLHSIHQCTAPCNLRIDREDYRKDIRRLRLFLEGKKDVVLAEMEAEMREASKALQFEKAARLRDEIEGAREPGPARRPRQARAAGGLLQSTREGPGGPAEGAQAASDPADDRRRRHRPPRRRRDGRLAGQFIDGLPFKPGYRRYRIKSVAGVDDFASIREVVTRRIQRPPASATSPSPTSS